MPRCSYAFQNWFIISILLLEFSFPLKKKKSFLDTQGLREEGIFEVPCLMPIDFVVEVIS